MQISGKTVVITGGGRGIGRELAKAFAAKGGRIAAFDLNQADLDETVAQCKAQGVEARGYVANVTDEQAVIAAMDAIVADLGSVDVLINNAGIVKDSLLLKVKDGAITGKMTLEQWQAVININLTGVFLCGREAAERMVKQGRGGVIINTTSGSGWEKIELLASLDPAEELTGLQVWGYSGGGAAPDITRYDDFKLCGR